MKSIYGKLILGFLVSILISFSFAGYFVLKNNSEELSEFTRVELQDATRLILNQMTYVEDDQVGQVLTNISESLNVAILVSHDDSEIVYGQFKKPDKLDEAISNLKEKKDGYIDMRNSFFQTVGTHFEIDGTQYTLFVQKNISQQENIFKHSALLAVGFIFIVGSVVFLIIADIIVKPITRLTRATQELAKGNYKVSVNYVGNDEIGRLNKSFNLMAQQLGKTIL